MSWKIETPRLILRPWTLDDLEAYLCLAGDEGYCTFSLPGQFSLDVEAAKETIGARMALFEEVGVCKLLVQLRGAGEVVGTCGLGVYPVDGQEEMELGYRLRGKFWGQGYATEAGRAVLEHGFGTLGLARVVAFAQVGNGASLRVLSRLGFRYLKGMAHAGLAHELWGIEKGSHEGLPAGRVPDGLPDRPCPSHE